LQASYLGKRLSRYKDTVETQLNGISKLEADQKATETDLKVKLQSVQLAAKENVSSLLACVSGGKSESVKAKRDLLDSTKSLAKALKAGLGSKKKVQLLLEGNADLQNDLGVASSKLKDVEKQINENKKNLKIS
jgi:hypothetical protein